LESKIRTVLYANDQVVKVLQVFDFNGMLLYLLVSPGIVAEGGFVLIDVVGTTGTKQ
jgi:hypothetical protein